MNILLINHYAGNPQLGMEFRPYYLAKEWIKQGHKVLIVGATYSHLRKEQPAEGLQTYDGVDYLWLKTNTYSGNGIKRLWSMFAFVFRLFSNAKRLVRFFPDAVIASSTYPLDIYPARYIAKKAKAKLVFEIHDLWPLSPMELGGMSKYHPFIMMMQWAENYAYKHCDRCISILPCVHEHVKAHGLDLEKLHLVPNGIVLEDWENPEPLLEENKLFFIDLKKNYKYIIGYTGGHALSNSLGALLKVAELFSNTSVAFVLVGEGVEKKQLQQTAAENNLNHVFFLNPIPKKQIPNLLQLMDILYVGGINNSLYRFGISPNKLYDYMMASKPVILSVTTGKDLIAEVGCGISVGSEDPQLIAEAIRNIISVPETQRIEMGVRGKEYVLRYHPYSILSQNIIDAIFNTVNIST